MKKKSLIEQVPLALFMGLLVAGATAFFFIQMPMVLIEQAVIASGLPTVIAAAGPPLGTTARILVSGSAALGAGGFTWLMITLAGLIGRPRKPRVDEPAAVPFAAYEYPSRRPIFAHSDLGDPLVAEAAPPEAQEVREEIALAEWEEIVVEPTIELQPEQVLELVEVIAEEERAAPPTRSATIGELMARLETGAARRRARQSKPRPVERAPISSAADFDGALRNALNELQRMAAR